MAVYQCLTAPFSLSNSSRLVLAQQHVSWVFLGHVIKQGVFPNLAPLTPHEVSFFGVVF